LPSRFVTRERSVWTLGLEMLLRLIRPAGTDTATALALVAARLAGGHRTALGPDLDCDLRAGL